MRLITYSPLLLVLFVTAAEASTDIKRHHKHNKQQLITTEKQATLMIDFTEQQNLDSWRITNDDVMGGKSAGRFLLQDDKALFTGDISLANNGGFSSVFRAIEALPKALESVVIDVAGDGLTYQLRMTVNLDGYRLAYKHDFNTLAGQREKVTVTLADFQASFRGRNIANAPILQSENIREVGFLVTRKMAGRFSLAVFSITFK